MRNLVFITLLILFISTVSAQTSQDSIRFCDPDNWKTLHKSFGIMVKELKTKLRKDDTFLFDAPQHIYIMELAPGIFRIEPVQDEKMATVGTLLQRHKAIAAVNGGFFDTDPEPKNAAIANDFLKIRGHIAKSALSGWGTGAVGFDSESNPKFTLWNQDMVRDTIGWSAAYDNIMVAGPMIILAGESQIPWGAVNKAELADQDKRHIYAPRTAIGLKADGTIVLVVIDGRRKRAYGASFAEMAVVGRWLKLTDMLNLDGGGSSTMWYKNNRINFPSDGGGVIPLQRKVANAILVLPK